MWEFKKIYSVELDYTVSTDPIHRFFVSLFICGFFYFSEGMHSTYMKKITKNTNYFFICSCTFLLICTVMQEVKSEYRIHFFLKFM